MINKLHKTERKRNSYRSHFRALKIRMRLGYGLFPSFVLLCVHLLRFLGICTLKISFWRLQRTDLTFVANQLSMCSESTLTCSESTCSDLQRNGFVAKRPDTVRVISWFEKSKVNYLSSFYQVKSCNQLFLVPKQE